MAQSKLRVARITEFLGKFVGITLGCFVGMFPLIFLTPATVSFTPDEAHVHNRCFQGVNSEKFRELMDIAEWLPDQPIGSVIVQRGRPLDKVILVLEGEVLAHNSERDMALGRSLPVCKYRGKYDIDAETERGACRIEDSIPLKGCLIGSSIALQSQEQVTAKLSEAYPYHLVALEAVTCIRWDAKALREKMEDAIGLRVGITNLLYQNIDSRNKAAYGPREETFGFIVEATIADGEVADSERHFIEDYMRKQGINDSVLMMCLGRFGWTEQNWQDGEGPLFSDNTPTDGIAPVLRRRQSRNPSIMY